VLSGWPSAVAGVVVYRLCFAAMSPATQSSIGWEAWRTAVRTFYAGTMAAFARIDLQHIVATLWLAMCAIVVCRFMSRFPDPQKKHAGVVLFLLTSIGASVLGPATTIIGGSNGLTVFDDYLWTMHYMHPTFLFPLFAWPLLLGLLPSIRLSPLPARAVAFSAAVICFALPVMAFDRMPAPPVSVSQYAP